METLKAPCGVPVATITTMPKIIAMIPKHAAKKNLKTFFMVGFSKVVEKLTVRNVPDVILRHCQFFLLGYNE